jgi:hypothetical protein
MFLNITIDKPINDQLLLEELAPVTTTAQIYEGHLLIDTTDPQGALQVYTAHDHTGTSQAELDLTTRWDKAQQLRDQAQAIDWASVDTAQAITILHRVVDYLIARFDTENE